HHQSVDFGHGSPAQLFLSCRPNKRRQDHLWEFHQCGDSIHYHCGGYLLLYGGSGAEAAEEVSAAEGRASQNEAVPAVSERYSDRGFALRSLRTAGASSCLEL